MSKRLLGIDVDDCILPDMTDVEWRLWCINKFGMDSDTGEFFEDHPYQVWGEDSLDFWRAEDLYDFLVPDRHAQGVIENLSSYFDIVFISKLKGQHHTSKVYMLKKHFPYMKGFMGTHEKWLMNDSVVAMIDDSPDMLKGFDQNKRVMKETKYNQDSELQVAYKFSDWSEFDIAKFCQMYLK